MGSWSFSSVVLDGMGLAYRRKVLPSSSSSSKSNGCSSRACYSPLTSVNIGQTRLFRPTSRRGRTKASFRRACSNKSRFQTKDVIIAILFAIGVIVVIARAASLGNAGGRKNGKDNSLYPPDPVEPQPPSWSKLGTFKRGAVCADGAPCALIGKSMLDKNGSAVDAALAAMICNGLINMQSMGLGGGFLMTIYERSTQRAFVLNARDSAPLAAHANMYDGKPDRASRSGALAITVPGELAGYWEAHQRFGKLPWADLFQPNIELCEEGYNLTRIQYDGLSFNKSNIYGDPTLKEMFVDPETNEFRKPGSIIHPRELCKTMRIIATKNATELYNGTLGRILIEDVQKKGGILTIKDLNEYRAKWEEPVEASLSNGVKCFSAGLPGSGHLLVFILNILDGFNFSPNSVVDVNSTVTTYHRMIEAFKYAYALRTELGDKDYIDVSDLMRNLTSKEYAQSTRTKINDERTWNDPQHYGASATGDFGDHGTAHISVLAPNGDAVSVTSSVNLYFGSGVVSERTGILMNSGMDDFGISSQINYFDLPASPNNYIQPGKRAVSSMAPSILVGNNGDARMVIGAAGGTKITTSMAYVITRHLWLNNTIKEAVDAARIHHQLFPMKMVYEFGVTNQVVNGLQRLGHDTKRYRNRGSVICALVQVNGTVYANADYRKGGDVYGID